MGVSRRFVSRWTQSGDQDPNEDHRGWTSGKRRKWTDETEARIRSIHAELQKSVDEFFTGATAVRQVWLQHYKDSPPPLRTIGRIMKELGLTTQTKGKCRGAAKYLLYPENAIYGGHLGDRVMEADFIERRYLQGMSTPLNFVGISAKKNPKFRYYRRIESLTVEHFLAVWDDFFWKYDQPDLLKLDNAATFAGSTSGKRTLSRVMIYLLDRRIIPVFAVPRKPFSQGSIEGNNSIFSRFFWNRRHFETVADIDTQLEKFNEASLRYSGYEKPPEKSSREGFVPKVCFIRQIGESEVRPGQGAIHVLNEEILLPSEWINFFVLAEWNLQTQTLEIMLEKKEGLTCLADVPFKINPNSLKKLKQSGAHSFGL